ncbi:DTW domain-containing protein [Microbulbifer agarilyticus]|uniref:tRNA-uridine aminocarboxypropyltransferase n=1 Tax=Microbulbifer agarilyticus TaxID=260552 RepID=UPI001C94CCFE|nr:tRNA-uridine aminocarboxypropyltransferase [Microbulbifer agarilyticus]MBY6191236.1 DTW domain-containing protein [Microbulbifer agarilyticus]
MEIILLTHERELAKPTNTGKLALVGEAAAVVRRVVWKRTEPDVQLLQLLQRADTGLVYPSSEVHEENAATESLSVEDCQTFILLDATWQEARKMFNRSAYLNSAPRVELTPGRPSRFNLRRNQRDGGLCTAECVIEILRAKGENSAAEELEARFSEFLQASK